ncbi:fimbrial subunit [Proteus mirabilis]|nr:fimbrial subunit [Proteus mirabilis]
MKKVLLSLAMLSVISTPVLAKTPVANLKINGDIKPPTCTVHGATQSDVIFDYGVISPTLIPQSKNYEYPLATGKNTVTVECDAKTYLTFVASDTYDSAELANDTTGQFHLVDKANPEAAVGAAFLYGQILLSMVSLRIFHEQMMLLLRGINLITSYTKALPMVGPQNNNQILIKTLCLSFQVKFSKRISVKERQVVLLFYPKMH